MAKVGSTAMFKGLPSSRTWKQAARLNQIAGTPQTAYKFDPKYTKSNFCSSRKTSLHRLLDFVGFGDRISPTLKFHNDDVDFVLTRIATKTKEDLAKCPTKIILHHADGSVQELDCSNKHSNKILKELVALSEAKAVPKEEIPVVKHVGEEL